MKLIHKDVDMHTYFYYIKMQENKTLLCNLVGIIEQKNHVVRGKLVNVMNIGWKSGAPRISYFPT